MATWTVHAPEGDLGQAIATDRLVFSREGFAWGALWLPFVWAPLNRLWLVLAGWLAATVAIEVFGLLVGDAAGAVLAVGFALWFAASANDFKRWTLERRGFRLLGLTSGSNLDEAELRFFAKLAGTSVDVLPPTAPSPRFAFAAPLTPPRDLPPIVGFAGVPGDRP